MHIFSLQNLLREIKKGRYRTKYQIYPTAYLDVHYISNRKLHKKIIIGFEFWKFTGWIWIETRTDKYCVCRYHIFRSHWSIQRKNLQSDRYYRYLHFPKISAHLDQSNQFLWLEDTILGRVRVSIQIYPVFSKQCKTTKNVTQKIIFLAEKCKETDKFLFPKCKIMPIFAVS